MPDNDFKPGLEGVIAFESEIAEPDKEGGALRYRGVDIKDLVGKVSFGQVWGLLVDNEFEPGLPPAEPFPLPVHTGDIRVDVQSALAQLAPIWGFRPLLDITAEQAREDLARASVMALSFIGQSAHGLGSPMVPQSRVDEGRTIVERFMIRWRGEPDPAHVEAVDAYWVSAAEHGMNASTFTARVIASTGADVAACLTGAVGALSGPLHGGAPSRAQHMIEGVEKSGNAEAYVADVLNRGERLMGFGHRVYRAYDPRAAVLRDTCQRLGAPRYEVALELEKAAIAAAGRALSRAQDGDQRRLLGGRPARLRRRASDDVHPAVRLRPHGRLGRPHPGAEEHRPPDPPVGALRRPRSPPGRGRHRLRADPHQRLTRSSLAPPVPNFC